MEKFVLIFFLIGIAFLGADKKTDQVVLGREFADASSVKEVAAVSEAILPEARSMPVAAENITGPGSASEPADVFIKQKDVPEPKLKVEAALVADLETGKFYFEKNSSLRWPIASITKIFSAELAMDQMPLDRRIDLSGGKLTVSGGGDISKESAKISEQYSLEDLIHAMLIFSSNDAAEAIAQSYGRSDFIQGLNLLAENWGLSDTHFSDPTGLSAGNQSTPKDLLAATREIRKRRPEIFETTRKQQIFLVELNSGKTQAFGNINEFAGKPDFLGGKTGFTNEANGNLLSLFEYGKRPVLVLVLGTGDRFGETKKLIDWFEKSYAPAAM